MIKRCKWPALVRSGMSAKVTIAGPTGAKNMKTLAARIGYAAPARTGY
jgi:hypothetical protein